MEHRTTTCPFCLNGCTTGVKFDGYRFEPLYPSEGKVNRGRLCPRGNSAGIVIDHWQRLCHPQLDGHEISWSEAELLVRQWLASVRPEELAFVYSRGRTMEEIARLHGLAKELGTPNLVCGYIEPENNFGSRLEGVSSPSLEQVEQAKAVLLVGDVFATSPVASYRILEARYADRKNRMVVLDSMRTRQSAFAHHFILARPGTEHFALVALAALVDSSLVPGVDVERFAGLAGVQTTDLRAAAAALQPGTPGFVGCAMHFGRVKSPWLMSLAAQAVALVARKPFLGFAEAVLPAGTMRFANLRKAMASGRVRMLFWTGGLFPYSYPELLPETGKVEFLVATSIFRPSSPVRGLLLPVSAELERASTGDSYWGAIERQPLAAPLSGASDFGEVLQWFGNAAAVKLERSSPIAIGDVLTAAEKASRASLSDGGLLLLGEKKAIGIRGFHDNEDMLRLSPTDAAAHGLKDGDWVLVKSPVSELEFRLHVTDAVVPGSAVAGVNVHRNRSLFPLVDDELVGETTVPPVEVMITKTGKRATLPGENPSVWS